MSIARDRVEPFPRELRSRLELTLRDRIARLANGSATRHADDHATVAEKYAAQTSYIQAIRDVFDRCMEIERERYGVPEDDGSEQ